VDRTGLEGRWEFVLHFSREERDPNAPLGLYPSLFTALQNELGLKLVPFVGKNKLLVIDHIERPTEN
jgi:bla regulator protein BlaR1